jgi:hypothetical protein
VREWKRDFEEIKKWIDELKEMAPCEIRHESYSTVAMLPFKVAAIREIFIHRVIELSDISIEMIDSCKYLAAAILIRSIMETTAMLYYVLEKVKNVTEGADVGDVDVLIMRVMLGCNEKEGLEKPINVLTAIQKIDKWLNKIKPKSASANTNDPFMVLYSSLSEYTHPNWLGGLCVYAEMDDEFKALKFSSCSTENIPISQIVGPFAIAMNVFKNVYLDFNVFMKKFIKICEEDLK